MPDRIEKRASTLSEPHKINVPKKIVGSAGSSTGLKCIFFVRETYETYETLNGQNERVLEERTCYPAAPPTRRQFVRTHYRLSEELIG